ncbi:MAG TPA: TetR/AcrR family transcriptional regulator [Rhodothermales bacterium]|nr:TetR/AcrR family transcriptional regulator [Rhodothermales bacterium]
MSDEAKKQRYRKRKRAIQEQKTRQLITKALVELHRTVGPASTTVTEVAERAGVSRMTVYNHFPTSAEQFDACSTHWFAQNPVPDLDAWAAVSDPSERLRLGLTELYSWYCGTQDMMENVLRDAAIVPEVGEILDARWSTYIDRMVDVLGEGWSGEVDSEDRRAALRLVVDFRTWQVLVDSGLDGIRAAGLAFRMVECGLADAPKRQDVRSMTSQNA